MQQAPVDMARSVIEACKLINPKKVIETYKDKYKAMLAVLRGVNSIEVNISGRA